MIMNKLDRRTVLNKIQMFIIKSLQLQVLFHSFHICCGFTLSNINQPVRHIFRDEITFRHVLGMRLNSENVPKMFVCNV